MSGYPTTTSYHAHAFDSDGTIAETGVACLTSPTPSPADGRSPRSWGTPWRSPDPPPPSAQAASRAHPAGPTMPTRPRSPSTCWPCSVSRNRPPRCARSSSPRTSARGRGRTGTPCPPTPTSLKRSAHTWPPTPSWSPARARTVGNLGRHARRDGVRHPDPGAHGSCRGTGPDDRIPVRRRRHRAPAPVDRQGPLLPYGNRRGRHPRGHPCVGPVG
jgi:hypothetical protein